MNGKKYESKKERKKERKKKRKKVKQKEGKKHYMERKNGVDEEFVERILNPDSDRNEC